MGLEKYQECGNQASANEDKGTNCGDPVKKEVKTGCLIYVVIAIFVLTITILGIVSEFFNERSKEYQRQEQTKIEAKLEREKKGKEILVSYQKQKEKEKFISEIEDHYQKVLALYNTGKYEDVAKELEKFISYQRIGYKDIRQISAKLKINDLEKKLKNIPDIKIYEKLVIYEELMDIDPTNLKYKKENEKLHARYKKKMEDDAIQIQKETSDLELLSWRWSEEYGYATAEGQVKNISKGKMENVEALVTWYDKNGDMITSNSALIEYNPILPGQTSPFKVIQSHNPAMKRATIEFKFIFGNAIPTFHKKK